ncbi:Domain of uncharacterised function (DUF1887) [Vibrio cholerae]|nr:Domain of uncharacterised function (DUF1887) [Vibrio cholerae]
MPTIQDRSLNVQVYRQLGEREVRNELDVATVVNNKPALYAITILRVPKIWGWL